MADDDNVLSWRSWPLAAYPGRTAAALGVTAAAGAAIFFLWQSPGLAAIGVLALLASLHGHLLPRRYVLDDDGVSISVLGITGRKSWDHYHSYYADRLGVMLSTFTYPSRLDPFRGANLRFAGGDRDAIIAFVSARLPRAEKRGRRGKAER
jgi:hypothetical protein